MGKWLTLLAVLGACGRLDFDLRAAVDGATEGNPDPDGDGVRGAADDCPTVADPAQDDEDGDAIGDACDPCPMVAGDAADGDGDGVGDACDPRPTTAGDQLVLFETFRAGAPAGVTLVGTWSFAGGQATVTSGNNKISYLLWDQRPTGGEVVWTQGTIDQIFPAAGGPRSLGTEQQYDPSTNFGNSCEHQVSGGGIQIDGVITTQSDAHLATAPTTFAVGTTSTFVERRAGTTYGCRTTELGAELTATSALSVATAKVGIRTNGMSGHFAWVAIIATQ